MNANNRILKCQPFLHRVSDYVGKADLSKGYWNPKRKLGVTTHFSEIIKQQQFKKAIKHKAIYGGFVHIEAMVSLKMHGYPHFSFWIPKLLAKFCFLCIVLNRAKNIPLLVGTTHRKTEYLEMRRTYAQ